MNTHKLLSAAISFSLCICTFSSGLSHPVTAESTTVPVASGETLSSDSDSIRNVPVKTTTVTTSSNTKQKTTTTTAPKTTAKSSATTSKPQTTKITVSTTKPAASTSTTTSTTSKQKTTEKSSSTTKTTTTTSKPKTTTTTEVPHMLGDIDNDKMYTGTDATLILMEYTLLSGRGYGQLSAAQQIACDIDKDGIITGSDATLSLYYYTYLSSYGILELEDFLKYGPIDIHKPPKTTTTTTTTTTTSTTTSTDTSSTTTTSTTTTTLYDDPYTVQAIELSKYEITVKVGSGDISIVKMLPASAPDVSEKWWSSDTSIATVNYEGWITGIAPGECTVTVQSVNNPDVTAEIKVTVIDNRVSEIKLDKYEVTIGINEGDMPLVTMLPADAPDFSEKWWSSDTSIATVNSEGWITGIAPGECTVIVQSVNNPDVTAEVKVTVIDNRVTEIKLDKYEVVIKAGFGDMPLVTMLPANAPDKSEIWRSSNTEIATVNIEGWITGIAPGECIVTVYSAANPDIKAEVKVIVTE